MHRRARGGTHLHASAIEFHAEVTHSPLVGKRLHGNRQAKSNYCCGDLDLCLKGVSENL